MPTLADPAYLPSPTAVDVAAAGEPTHPYDLRLLAVSAAGFCVFLSVYATQALLPMLTHVFRASEAQVSRTVTATTVGVALTAPAIGLLAERVGRKRVIVSAIFLLAVPTFLAAGARSLDGLIGWRFAQGLVMPGIIAVTMAYVAEQWEPRHVGSAMAAYVTGNVLAGVVGRFMSGWVGAAYGWPRAFVVLGALDLIGGAVVLLCLPVGRPVPAPAGLGGSVRQMGRHLRNAPLLAAFAVGFNVLLALVGTFTYVTFHLAAAPFHLGPRGLGSLFLVYLVGVFVTPLGGKFIDRRGQRFALLVALAVCAGGLLLTLVPTLAAIVVGLTLLSSGVFVCQSATASYMGLAAGRSRASAAGLYASFYYLGGAAGAFVPGLFWRYGHWPMTVAFLVVVLASTAVIASAFWTEHSG